MRTLFILIVAVLAALSFRPSFAETTSSAKWATGRIVVAAKAEVTPETNPESLTGKVVAVDEESKRLTVKESGWFTSKETTFTVAEEATPILAELQPGDEVKVGYFKHDEELIASSISRSPAEQEKRK